MKYETVTERACTGLQDLRFALTERDERTRMKISFRMNYGLTGITITTSEEPVVHLQEHFLVHLHVPELVQPSPHLQVSAQTRSTSFK